MSEQVCPFQWGDRVDHHVFGFGTVEGDPTPNGQGGFSDGSAPRSWVIPVKWDDPQRKEMKIAYNVGGKNVLAKVPAERTLSRAYWFNEWQKLLDQVIKDRKATDDYLKNAFGPKAAFDPAGLDALRKVEAATTEKALDFLLAGHLEDRAGES